MNDGILKWVSENPFYKANGYTFLNFARKIDDNGIFHFKLYFLTPYELSLKISKCATINKRTWIGNEWSSSETNKCILEEHKGLL